MGKRGIFEAKYVAGEAQLLTLKCVGTGKYWTADEDGILSCSASNNENNQSWFFVQDASKKKNETGPHGSTKRAGRLVSDNDSDESDDSDDEFSKQFLAKQMGQLGDSDDDQSDDDASLILGASNSQSVVPQKPKAPATKRALSSMMDDSDSEED